MKKFPENMITNKNLFPIGLMTIFIVSIFLPLERVEARKFFGLKVHGNHRVLEPIVSEIPKNRSGGDPCGCPESCEADFMGIWN